MPIIEAATSDHFVPQMLNFEVLDGIDFRKGCYPGQEVVARSQYRGTIKRRMLLFSIAAPDSVLPAQEIYNTLDAAQPVGEIVNAAQSSASHGGTPLWRALVELKIAALESGELRLGSPTGALLRQIEMPYAVPFETTSVD